MSFFIPEAQPLVGQCLEFVDRGLQGIYIGKGEGKHGTPDITAAFKGRVDSTIETVPFAGKYIGLPGSKLFGPKATEDKELSVISGKFIGFEKHILVVHFNRNEQGVLSDGRGNLGETS